MQSKSKLLNNNNNNTKYCHGMAASRAVAWNATPRIPLEVCRLLAASAVPLETGSAVPETRPPVAEGISRTGQCSERRNW
jgi:hypothetical protein